VVDFALALDKGEERGHAPTRAVDDGRAGFGQHTRNVIHKPAAGDVRHAAHRHFRHQGGDGFQKTAVHRQQRLGHGVAGAGDQVLRRQPALVEDHFARQRVTVGLQPAGGQADDDVAGLDLFAGDDPLARHRSHDRADQVILVLRIEPGHLGGLAAQQRTAVLFARFAQAGDHLFENGGVKARGPDVIHEKQRRGPLDKDVVNAVIDDILADGVVALGQRGDLELGADAVGAGDQQMLLARRLKEAAEAADPPHHPLGGGGAHHLLDDLNARHF